MQLDLPYCRVARFREMADAAIRSDPEGRDHFPNHGAKGAFRFTEPKVRYRTTNRPIPANHRQRPWSGSRLPAEYTILIDRAFMGQPGFSVIVQSADPPVRTKAARRDYYGWGNRTTSVRYPRLSGGARPTTSCVVEFVPIRTYAKVHTICPGLKQCQVDAHDTSLLIAKPTGVHVSSEKSVPTNA